MNTIIENQPADQILARRDVALSEKRWREGQRRQASSVTTLGVHHTAVAGGMSPGKRRLARHGGDLTSAKTERYRNLPYHAVYSPQLAASIIQWPAWMYTSHGHRMNSYSIGWAIDMDSRSETPNPELVILAGSHVVYHFRDRGCPIRYLETHSQHSNKPHDPGPWVLEHILKPLAQRCGLEIRFDRSSGKGKPLS